MTFSVWLYFMLLPPCSTLIFNSLTICVVRYAGILLLSLFVFLSISLYFPNYYGAFLAYFAQTYFGGIAPKGVRKQNLGGPERSWWSLEQHQVSFSSKTTTNISRWGQAIILNKLTISSQLMMNFSMPVGHEDAIIVINGYWCITYLCESCFYYCLGVKGKKNNNTLVLGNGDDILPMGILNSMLRYNKVIVKSIALSWCWPLVWTNWHLVYLGKQLVQK